MTGTSPIQVDVISDMVCPWCFLGQRRLEKAIANTGIEVTTRWRPFQLDPTIPPEGMDRQEYMLGKFGDLARLHDIHARLDALGRQVDIDFNFDAIRIAPNTLDAHRVIHWAGASGAQTQNTLVRDLFSRYFERGQNIGDHAILAQAAAEAGMDADHIRNLLATDQDRSFVADEVSAAGQMGITGVPCFLFERKYAVMGAQEIETLTGAIQQVEQAKKDGSL